MSLDYDDIQYRARNNAGYEVQLDIAALIRECQELGRQLQQWRAVANALATDFRVTGTASYSLTLYEKMKAKPTREESDGSVQPKN